MAQRVFLLVALFLTVAQATSDGSAAVVQDGLTPLAALAAAVKSGMPGFAAGALQVLALMWARSIMNVQSRYGGTMVEVAKRLYKEGGIARLYQGVGFAMLQNPLSKFGLAVVVAYMPKDMALPLSATLGSCAAAAWRMFLTPLDTCKTVLQVEGPQGFAALRRKLQRGQIGSLYNGAFASAAASLVAHFPWLLTYKWLSAKLAVPADRFKQLLRNAAIGLAASVAADVCSNSLRVLKTVKQSSAADDSFTSYADFARSIGVRGLLGRGLSTRVMTNAMQGMLFTVAWRYLHEVYVEAPAHKRSSL